MTWRVHVRACVHICMHSMLYLLCGLLYGPYHELLEASGREVPQGSVLRVNRALLNPQHKFIKTSSTLEPPNQEHLDYRGGLIRLKEKQSTIAEDNRTKMASSRAMVSGLSY